MGPRPPSVGDVTGDASAETPAALPTYNAPIVEGVSPRRPLPTVNADPVSMTATEDPSPAPVYSPLQQSQIRLRNLINQPLPGNRLASGGMLGLQAAGQAAQSGSVGRTIGAGLGGFLGGLVNKKAFAQEKQNALIQKQAQVVGMDAQGEKEQRAAQSEALNDEAKRAAIRHATKASLLGTLRVAGKYERGQNPSLDAQLEAADMVVPNFDKSKGGNFTWHESGGQSYTMNSKTGDIRQATALTADGTPAPIVDASKLPGVDGLTPNQSQTVVGRTADRTARVADNAANRALRLKVANIAANSRADIAAASQSIQRDRMKMSANQFASRYPGAGQVLSPDAVVQKAKQLNMLPEDVIKSAIRQGYQIGQ
jgi:hypothetical protein